MVIPIHFCCDNSPMGIIFSPSCRPPSNLIVKKVNPKSLFKSAENPGASSLWVGNHRYTSSACASKLKWVGSELKLINLDFELKRTEPSHCNSFKSAENRATSSQWVAVIVTRAFRARQNSYGFRAN